MTTNAEIIAAIVARLPEGDRHRVRLFAEALLQQRTGKRQQRRSRFQKVVEVISDKHSYVG